MPVEEKKLSYVTYDGRTIVDTDALLREPKVREAILKLGRLFKEKGRRVRIAKKL
jgi:hypothetical protein